MPADQRRHSRGTSNHRSRTTISRSASTRRPVKDGSSDAENVFEDEQFRRAETDLDVAKRRLHVAAVPETLPCRENEFINISAHLYQSIEERQGSCLYISGVPGTGKTATVREVLRSLNSQSGDCGGQDGLPAFDVLEINGMTVTDPNYTYTLLWERLSGRKLPSAQAQQLLDEYFNPESSAAARRQRRPSSRKMCILVMDELDQLVTKKQTLIYNMFNWPTRPDSNLIVIAIANTMDLPERVLSNKVASRLGMTRINFQPYTFDQLEMIIKSRLEGLRLFDQSAVILCARKVSSVSGDARRALDICRLATVILERTADKSTIGAEIVSQAIHEMYSSPSIRVIMSASLHQKLFIHSFIGCTRESGIGESDFGTVANRHTELCRLYNIEPPNMSEMSAICASLGVMHLLLVQPGKTDVDQKIRLNAGEDDIRMAFRTDELMQQFTN